MTQRAIASVTHRFRRYEEGAEIGKKGACHVFRHTMATAMLEHGADVRYVQEMLGHASLATTQIYTRVSIKKLKDIHTPTHPSARLERCPPSSSPSSNGGRPVEADADTERAALLRATARVAAREHRADEGGQHARRRGGPRRAARPSMKLRVTPRALAEAKRIKTWWQRHREAAPDLFEQGARGRPRAGRAATPKAAERMVTLASETEED